MQFRFILCQYALDSPLYKKQFMTAKYNMRNLYLFGIVYLFPVLFLTGCKTPKNVAYFQDLTQETIQMPSPGQIKIAPNDKLSIVVKTMDPELSMLFNLATITDRLGEGSYSHSGAGTLRSSSYSSSGISKYTVSPQGTIDFPLLGVIKVAGMTRFELAGFIKGELMGKDLAKDPIVTVEFVNLGVSILGEVSSPGQYDINKDQINILEAISMAGDLTLLGKRENVAVVRETNGEVKTYRLDLTNFKELTESPAYYLQQGDVIYVEPNEMRKRQTTNNGNNVLSTSFWISVASLLTSVVTTIGVFVVK